MSAASSWWVGLSRAEFAKHRELEQARMAADKRNLHSFGPIRDWDDSQRFRKTEAA